MRRSYWRYLYYFEKSKWDELYNGYSALAGLELDDAIEKLVELDNQYGIYNPLTDTRPYYYATYNAVRGTGKVYKPVQGSASGYVIDPNKGDEFQMNSRIDDPDG